MMEMERWWIRKNYICPFVGSDIVICGVKIRSKLNRPATCKLGDFAAPRQFFLLEVVPRPNATQGPLVTVDAEHQNPLVFTC